jgi:hypothetical protein
MLNDRRCRTCTFKPKNVSIVVFALAYVLTREAYPQEVSMMETSSGSSYGGAHVSKKTRTPIIPAGRLELGGELAFVTADRDLDQNPIRFTDVALLPLHVRYAPSRWVELSGGTAVLIKESESMSEKVWQGSNLAMRVPFGSVFAGTIHGALGPLMKRQGLWWQGESGLLAKLEASREMRFELRSGYALTVLKYADANTSAPNAWIHEWMAHGEIQFGEQEAGGWIGADYYIPVASGPGGDNFGHPALNPNARLNLEIGAVATPRNTNWDLYVVYAIIDRGDVTRPGTTLPILSGGFDQRILMLGVQHHFDLQKKRRASHEYE